MKTLYKFSIALGITEYIYFFVWMYNLFMYDIADLMGIGFITILGISGFTCYYVQMKRDVNVATGETKEAEVKNG